MKNYYEILGVPASATKEEIKAAFRKLSLRLHPDQNKGDRFFEDMFRQLNEAYEVLSNDLKRARYDYELKKQQASSHGSYEAELKRKEEELKLQQDRLRRRQEELKRQEQTIRQKATVPVQRAEAYVPEDTWEQKEATWNSICLVLFIINVLLVTLIYTTSAKESRNYSNEPARQERERTDYQPSIVEEESPGEDVIEELPLSIETEKDATSTFYEGDSVSLPVSEPLVLDTVSEEPQQVVDTDTVVQEGVDGKEKPKWFQFRKRKEWRKTRQDE